MFAKKRREGDTSTNLPAKNYWASWTGLTIVLLCPLTLDLFFVALDLA